VVEEKRGMKQDGRREREGEREQKERMI